MDPRQLAAFYRWLVYIPANIYPTVTVIEFPERYVNVPEGSNVTRDEAKKWVAAETSKRREDVWRLLENVSASDTAVPRETTLTRYFTEPASWT